MRDPKNPILFILRNSIQYLSHVHNHGLSQNAIKILANILYYYI